MKGNNKLVFNTSTMIEITQYWLDREMPKMAESQQVTGILSVGISGVVEFEVYLSDRGKTGCEKM